MYFLYINSTLNYSFEMNVTLKYFDFKTKTRLEKVNHLRRRLRVN